ncbi:MAG: peroxiredoxin [Nevskiaceae bacterium]|jgi:peroxiredoxin Q/BCP|nr:peroxiredoxin [Nevskiaceae bacterium]
MAKAKAKAKAKPATATVNLDQPVPDFTLPSTAGEPFTLSAQRGTAVVLYFYPKDATPGCTLEAQQFRDLHAKLRRAGASIWGISRDSLASHERFRAAQKLPFHLLSDADESVCRLFDVIREKNMYGRKVLGIERSTFLIDQKGLLRHEWRKVKVADHAEIVLEALRALD